LSILGFLLLSAPALAGDVYSFTIDRSGGNAIVPTAKLVADPGSAKGTVTVDGRKYRIELAPAPESGRPYDVLVSNDGGDREIALSLHDHTYFEPDKPELTSPLFHLLPIPGDRSVSGVTMTVADQPEEVSGAPAQRHEIKLAYDITLVIPPPPNMPPGF